MNNIIIESSSNLLEIESVIGNSDPIINIVYENFSNISVVTDSSVLINHEHISSNITDFSSAVSGLLPVKNLLPGTNIGISSSSGIYTVSVTGTLGLTGEQVDDRVSNLLIAGTGISLNYNDNANTLTITASGSAGVGTSGYVAKWSDTNTLTSGIIYDDGTNIGIGVINPSSKLTIDGGIRLLDNTVGTTGNKIQLFRGTGTVNDYTIGKEGNNIIISTVNDSNTQRALQVGYHSGLNWIPKVHINGYTGAVGVNTTAPSGFLDVAGDIYVRGTGNNLGTMYFKSASYSETSLKVRADPFGNLYLDAGPYVYVGNQDGRVVAKAQNAWVDIGNAYNSSSINQHIRFTPANVERVRITNLGDVGIGTTTPSGKLNVIGTGLFATNTGLSPSTLLSVYSTTSGAMLFNVEGTNGSLFSVVDNLSGSLMSVNNNAGLPVFEVFSNDSIIGGRFNQNDFVISSGGNLGLGTSSPSGKLHVVGRSIFASGANVYGSGSNPNNNSDPLIIESITGSGSVLRFKDTVSNDWSIGVNPNGAIQTGSSSGNFAITKIVSGTGIPYVIINNSGNIGIGGSPSTYKLNVIGTGNFSQNLLVNGTGVSISGHTHASSDITNFNNSVSGLISGIYALLNSPNFSGIPTVPTATSGTNNDQIASTSFVRTEISNLIDSAPSTLDTLNELAAALGDDANFATTLTNNLAGKANLSGATFTGSISSPSGDFVVLKQNGVVVSVSGHTHSSTDITNFNNSVSGLLPLVTGVGYINTTFTNNTYSISATGLQPSGNYSLVGHSHISSDVTDFNSSVSGLLPVKNISAGNYISVTPVSGDFTISATGLQPSGNYSIVGHTHTSSNITDFSSSVSGLLPSISGSGYVISSFENNIYNISVSGLQPSGNYSIVGHTHNASDITDFNSSVSGLLPVKDIVNGNYISITSNLGEYTISATGLQPSGNYSITGHQHVSTDITDFNSTVSGLLVPYALLNSPNFSGIPTAPTATSGTNTNQIASTAFVRTEISNLIDSAPSTLDTLNELAAALADDANFSTTITNSLAAKANLNGATFTGTITGPSGDFVVLKQNGTVVSVNGHSHSSIDITDFNTSVSGLLPVKNISAGSYISITSVSGDFSVSATGLQPSGNYSTVNHTHTSSNITDFSSSVSGLLPSVNGSGYVISSFENNIYNISVSGLQPSGNYSVSGHTHLSSDITNFNTSVSGLLPSITGIGYVVSSFTNNVYSISATGLQPSGNYSLVGHTHVSSDITDFNASVSGLLPTISNSGDNRLLTSTGSTVGINAENNLTFDGSTLNISNNITATSGTLTTLTADKVILTSGAAPSSTTNSAYNLSGVLYYQNNPVAILPTGGLQNQLLQKISDTSYDLQWIDNFATEVHLYAKNITGGPLYKGQAVYVNGAQGDHPTISLAIASAESTSSKTIGLLKQDLNNNDFGYVVTEGMLESVDTNSATAAGDTIWLSPTVSGGLVYGTGNKPLAPYHLVFLGYVIRKQQNAGKIYIKTQNGFELGELHNVAVNGTSNGAFLQYNSASGLWMASSSGNFTSLSVNSTGVSINGHTHTSSNITDFNSSVSGLLPVKDVIAGTNISISSSSGSYTVSVSGSLGLTEEQVDDRISNLLLAGSGITLTYDDNANTLTIATSGLQPSGSYSLTGHTHSGSDITSGTIADARLSTNAQSAINLYLWSSFR